jgi:hypothetical protein
LKIHRLGLCSQINLGLGNQGDSPENRPHQSCYGSNHNSEDSPLRPRVDRGVSY